MKEKPKQYSFKERIGFSRGVSKTGNIRKILLDNIPGAFSISLATPEEDRLGTDFWAQRSNLSSLSIDLKARETDPLSFALPKDDLALETYSNVAKKTKGWTRDEHKRTDYILWLFQPTGRWVLVPFPMLCCVFSEKWMEWRKQYQTDLQKSTHNNETWYSECVFVPRVVVWQAIYDRYGGKAKSKAQLSMFELERLRVNWRQVIRQAPEDTKRTPVIAILVSAGIKPVAVEGDTVVLSFKYPLHKVKLEEPENRQVAERIIGHFLGHSCYVRCQMNKEEK